MKKDNNRRPYPNAMTQAERKQRNKERAKNLFFLVLSALAFDLLILFAIVTA